MQVKEAIELKRRWGDKPCEHPTLDKEYNLGAATGDYACTKCGRSAWGSNWNNEYSKKLKS